MKKVAVILSGCGRDDGSEIHESVLTMGGVHQACAVDACVIDEQHKVVSTPAYMLAHSIKEAASGIKKLVAAVLHLT
jgi:hypothetical protein